MIYSEFKYISKTQIVKLLKSKEDFTFFTNQEAIIINYKERDYRLFHIEDVYKIVKSKNLKINSVKDSMYWKFSNAICSNESIEFKFISSLRYSKECQLDVMIDKKSLEEIILNNKQLKENYDSIKCFTIKNKVFFDTDTLIELLLSNKLKFSTKDSKLQNDIRKAVMYCGLKNEIKNKNDNSNKNKI